jgi:hypothetical protein
VSPSGGLGSSGVVESSGEGADVRGEGEKAEEQVTAKTKGAENFKPKKKKKKKKRELNEEVFGSLLCSR